MTRIHDPAPGGFRWPALLLSAALAAALVAVPGPPALADRLPAGAVEGSLAGAVEEAPAQEAAPVGGEAVRDLPVAGVDVRAAGSGAARAEAEPLTGATPEDTAAVIAPRDAAPQGLAAGQAADADPADDGQLAALTAPRITSEFTAAGLTWTAEADNEVLEAALRVREDGEWSGWMSLEVLSGGAGEGTGPGAAKAGTDPVLTLGADGVQARVLTATGAAPANLSISLVTPGTATTDGGLEPAPAGTAVAAPAGAGTPGAGTTAVAVPASYSTSATAASAPTASTTLSASLPASVNGAALRPAIVTRAQWGANESQADTTDRRSLRLKASTCTTRPAPTTTPRPRPTSRFGRSTTTTPSRWGGTTSATSF